MYTWTQRALYLIGPSDDTDNVSRVLSYGLNKSPGPANLLSQLLQLP